MVAKGGNMARMGNRVTQVANAEAENSEDLEFKNSVSKAAVGVSDSKYLNIGKQVLVNIYKSLQLLTYCIML